MLRRPSRVSGPRVPEARSRSIACWLVAVCLWLGLSLLAASVSFAGDSGAPIGLRITVHQLSNQPGPADPRSDALDRKLRDEFRYARVRELEHHDLHLSLNETGHLRLPSGRAVNVKPLRIASGALLLSLEVEGRLRTRLRLPARHEVVIGAEDSGEGKVVLTLVPDF